MCLLLCLLLVFSNDPATPEIYTLSLHDALPILREGLLITRAQWETGSGPADLELETALLRQDRKSTRLNSSHLVISYAVFCLKKKRNTIAGGVNTGIL